MLSDCRDGSTERHWIGLLVAGSLALACVGCAAPIPTSHDDARIRARGGPYAARRPGGDSPDGRRRVRRRQRPRHRPRRRHPLVRGAPHPDRRRGRHQHGRPDRRRVRHRHGRRRNRRDARRRSTGTQMFGARRSRFKNIRRKADARAYPSRLEFGLKGGDRAADLAQQRPAGGLLLGRIAAPYYDVDRTSTSCRRRSARWPSIC